MGLHGLNKVWYFRIFIPFSPYSEVVCGVGAYSAEQIINHVYNLQIGGMSITSKLHARKLQLKAVIDDYNSV